jgi:hypothetical protein
MRASFVVIALPRRGLPFAVPTRAAVNLPQLPESSYSCMSSARLPPYLGMQTERESFPIACGFFLATVRKDGDCGLSASESR